MPTLMPPPPERIYEQEVKTQEVPSPMEEISLILEEFLLQRIEMDEVIARLRPHGLRTEYIEDEKIEDIRVIQHEYT